MADLALFNPLERYEKTAHQIFMAWYGDPDRRPMMRNCRDQTILSRITEALDAGFDEPTVRRALDECWKFTSKPAWETALNIAYRKVRETSQPVFSETQKAILRVRDRSAGGLASQP